MLIKNLKIVYICDIAQDVDDVIAIEWLFLNNYLKYVVLDGKSNDYDRVNYLLKLGIKFENKILENEKIIFCGGSYTKIAEYVKINKINYLFGNGGFCGNNIIEIPLNKFKNLRECPTYNFNLDIEAINNCLTSNNINQLYFISKNVCHSNLNTYKNIHKDIFLQNYQLSSKKCLHDLLMVKEGIKILKKEKTLCDFKNVDFFFLNKKEYKYTKWGSILNKNSKIKITTNFKKICQQKI